jgi:hypothetical protein
MVVLWWQSKHVTSSSPGSAAERDFMESDASTRRIFPKITSFSNQLSRLCPEPFQARINSLSRYRRVIPPMLRASLQGNEFVGRVTAYKFHHSRDSKFIYEDGSVKIGRLSDYRSIEKETLRDDLEGANWLGFPDDKPTQLGYIKDKTFINKLFIGAESASFQGLSIISHNVDLYSYCFSYENSKSVLKSFDDEDPFDSVSRCENIFSVADIVCKYHPFLKGSTYLCLPIVYRERMRSPHEIIPRPEESSFEKPRKFEDNKEGRIIFVPPMNIKDRPPLNPWSHPELRNLFKPSIIPIK